MQCPDMRPASKYQPLIYTPVLILQEPLRAPVLLADTDRKHNILVLMLTVLPSFDVGSLKGAAFPPTLTG